MAEEAPPGLSEFELGLKLTISPQHQDPSRHNTCLLILRCNSSFQNLTQRAGCWGINHPGIPGKSGSPPATPSWPVDPHKCTLHGLSDDACVRMGQERHPKRFSQKGWPPWPALRGPLLDKLSMQGCKATLKAQLKALGPSGARNPTGLAELT